MLGHCSLMIMYLYSKSVIYLSECRTPLIKSLEVFVFEKRLMGSASMKKAGKINYTFWEKICFYLLKRTFALRQKVLGNVWNGNEMKNLFQCFVFMYLIGFIVSDVQLREMGELYLGVNKFPLSWQIPGKLVITFYIMDATKAVLV